MQLLQADSGITVLFRHVPSKLVSIRYYAVCGSLDEHEVSEYGLCHALEHMFFAGTKTRSWQDITSQFRRLGAYSNASTGHGSTEYEVSVPRENMEKAYEILADLMYNGTFPSDRWENIEKAAIRNEILGYESSPEWMIEDLTFKSALGGPGFYHHPLGNKDSVQNASVEDLLAFKNRFYKGKNIFLSVAGDLTTAEVLDMVNRYDRREPGEPEERIKPVVGFHSYPDGWEQVGSGQPIILCLKEVRKIHDYETLAASEIFESAFNHYLMEEIREKRGLCYGIYSSISDDLNHVDYLGIQTSTADSNAMREAMYAIVEAVEVFVDQGLTDDAIHQARMEVYRSLLMMENSSEATSLMLAEAWMDGQTRDPVEAAEEYIPTVSSSKIRDLAKEYLTGTFKVTTLEEVEDLD